MSRSTVAKSRADKGGKSGYGNAPTPAVTHEIVTAKFNDQDWYGLNLSTFQLHPEHL